MTEAFSEFIGRTAELRQLRRHVFRDRLLTLVGPGGVGKSRLARRLAADATGSRFANQIWHINVAALDDPLRLAQTIALLLSIRRHSRQTWEHALLSALRTQQLAIVLDGCEHLLAPCAQLTELLLASCPGVHVLATSREPLGVDGEVVWRVAPLALPLASELGDQQQTRASDAVRLFVARASTRQAPFRLTAANLSHVVDICRRLGGLPLAIELAAARVPALGVQPLAARLTSRVALDLSNGPAAPPRQQSLRATLDWSYALLSQAEQLLLRRLAVFVGGWTLDAAEAVCCDDQLPRDTIASLLDQLVRKSMALVTAHETSADEHQLRYGLLPVTRQYVFERLAASGALNEVRERHAEVMLKYAAPVSAAPLDARHAASLETEHANMTAALRWAIGTDRGDMAFPLALMLVSFWCLRGRIAEAQAWLARCQDVPATGDLKRTKARVSCLGGYMTLLSGDPSAARTLVGGAVEVLHAENDGVGATLAHQTLAFVAFWQGDLITARKLCADARLRGDPVNGDAISALATFSQAAVNAMVNAELGDYVTARSNAARVRLLAQQRGDPVWQGRALFLQALTAPAGEAHFSIDLTRQALTAQRTNTDTIAIADTLCLLGNLLLESGDRPGALSAYVEALDVVQRTRQRIKLPRVLLGVAATLALRQPRLAVQLAALSGAMADRFRCSLWPSDLRRSARWLADVRHALSPADYSTAWAEGLTVAESRTIPVSAATAELIAPRTATAPGPLTNREAEVARLIARGASNRQIARELSISVETVRTHVDNILGKLGLHSRTQVAAWALRHELPSPLSS